MHLGLHRGDSVQVKLVVDSVLGWATSRGMLVQQKLVELHALRKLYQAAVLVVMRLHVEQELL